MKQCFVCQQDLDIRSKDWPNWEDGCGYIHTAFLFNADDSAHSECIWRMAKIAVYGEEDSEKCPSCSKLFILDGCCAECGEVYSV
jgi:hypothetical protein